MQIGAATVTGPTRLVNEDRFWYEGHVFVVADGMGGHAAGDTASEMAIQTVAQFDFPQVHIPPDVAQRAMVRAIRHANDAIWRRADVDSRLAGMGTTIVAAWVGHAGAVIGHVGDSRAYLLRKNAIRPLTEDHSVEAELQKKNRLPGKNPPLPSYRHILTRALGAHVHVDVDVRFTPLLPDDVLLLCTDGLTGTLSDDDILSIVAAAPDLQRAADALVTTARQKGATDDVTALLTLYSLPPTPSPHLASRRPADDELGSDNRRG